MTIFQSIFLGLIQGITEFLPISSSGHLAFFQNLWHLPKQSVVFDILLHSGTLMAILIFFRRDLIDILRKKRFQLIILLFIASLPAGFFGYLFETKIEQSFASLKLIALGFLFTAFFLFISKYSPAKKDIKNISKSDAFIIGLAQALALLPGVSRSGLTISSAILRKIKPEAAYQFSFFLLIPITLGAIVLKIPALSREISNGSLPYYFFGTLTSFLTGILSLRFLSAIIKKKEFYWFSIYLIIMAGVCLILNKTLLI